jgi:excisionase family DNA binding protein
MMLDTLPATADRESLREAIDALRHSSRGMVLLVLTSLRAQEGGTTHLDDAFGREPSASQYAEAVAWNISVATERRQHLIARSLARHEAASRLGVSAQAVSDMLDRGALVGLKEGREWRIPAWQFDEESPTGVLPGLRDLGSRFPGSVVSLSRWIERENPDLDGVTPRAALQRGNIEGVLRLVEAI